MTGDENEKQKGGGPPQDDSGKEGVIIPFDRAAKAEAEAEKAGPAEEEQVEAGELDREEVRSIIEALLFASSAPLQASRLATMAGVKSAALVRDLCGELKADYDSSKRAFALEEIAGGYQLLTRPEFNTWITRLRRKEQEDTLSQASLESLAIIAYRQPVTRAQIEDIRGVQSGYILRSLIEKGLVSVIGRSDELGHPLLYGTTKEFLDIFGLPSLKSLPKLDELEPKEDAQ